MAATDERAIHEFPTGTIDDNSLLIMDRPTLTPGEYETEKFAIANLALKILGGIDFPNNLDTDDQDIFGAINEVNAKAMNTADEYDDTATYAVGDLRIHNNTLYKCTTAITTPEAWNASHWTATSIADELISINSDINTKQDSLYGGTISTTDFDTLKKAKVYYVNGSSTVYNAPFDNCYGILEVLETAVPLQRFTSMGATRTSGVYEREFINNAWTSWVNARNRPILLVATANATLAANATTVVSYTFTVPTGYTIVSAYDDSYYAGLVATPIRINRGSGSKNVEFNYFATSGQTHTYTARALALPDVDIRT